MRTTHMSSVRLEACEKGRNQYVFAVATYVWNLTRQEQPSMELSLKLAHVNTVEQWLDNCSTWASGMILTDVHYLPDLRTSLSNSPRNAKPRNR